MYLAISIPIFGYAIWGDHWFKLFEYKGYSYLPLLRGDGLLLEGYESERLKMYGDFIAPSSVTKTQVHFALISHSTWVGSQARLFYTLKVLKNGEVKELSGDEMMDFMHQQHQKAVERRSKDERISFYLIQDILLLLGIIFTPVLLFYLLRWIKAGFQKD